MKTIKVSAQNMTEGAPTHANLSADIFIGQEVDGRLVRRDMKAAGLRTYVARRDPHQCISWDPDVLDVTHKGWLPFHQSGEAEGWKIRTPARGLLYIKGRLVENPDIKIAVAGWWAINSWGKDNAEGPFRKRIMLDYTLPVVNQFIDQMHRQDRTIIMEADSNNVRWAAQLRAMDLLNRGNFLDHAWLSSNRDLKMTYQGVWHGPRTGVGNDMQHESLNWSLRAV